MIATTPASECFDRAEIERALTVLIEPGQVTELRILGTADGKPRHGFFNDPSRLLDAAHAWSGKCEGVYVIPNPLASALLHRADNRVICAEKGAGATDCDVLRRNWVLVDFDVKRPANTSTTDVEHQKALIRAQACSASLTGMGWPPALVGDSGNGAHLLYPCSLPNDSETCELIRRAITALGFSFAGDGLIVDPVTFNASRVWKLYGTLAAKGVPSVERPHRIARLLPCDLNSCFDVTEAMLRSLADTLPPTRPAQPSGHIFDLPGWLAKHNLQVVKEARWKGTGRKYELAVCPLNPEHNSGEAFVAQQPNGALVAGCLHKSCSSLNWQTLRAMFEPERALDAPAYSEDWLSQRFIQQHGENLRYVEVTGHWHVWTGQLWKQDDTGAVVEMAREVCRESANELNAATPGKGRAAASARIISAVEKLSRSDRLVASLVDQWDTDAWLLNTPAGMIDLHTGEMRKHERKDFCSKITTVSPGGNCPRWTAFLDRVTGSDVELQEFLQRLSGYALSGSTRENTLHFFHGQGANGKTTYLETIRYVMGDYATSAPSSMFTQSNNDAHPTELARLKSARLVVSSEIERGKRWAETKIKALTGGDTLAARFIGCDFFTFVPQFKLVIAANNRPALRGVDESIVRRLILVPFNVVIPPVERDLELPNKLRLEAGGILAWAIQGCLAWQQKGLMPPERARTASADYLAEENSIGRWIEERCELGGSGFVATSALFSSWQQWCEDRGEFCGSIRAFSQDLEKVNGIERDRTPVARGFHGIGLRYDTYRSIRETHADSSGKEPLQ
ncbi:MAG: phage/plasmid primase, P4 family [Terriglobales bacterium]